jgi:hypothetical protein
VGFIEGTNADSIIIKNSAYNGVVLSNMTIASSPANAGGLIGYAATNTVCKIGNSQISGSVTSSRTDGLSTENTGGFVGYSGKELIITGSSSSATLNGSRMIGGFVGRAIGIIDISGSHVTGNITSKSESAAVYAGGFIGLMDGATTLLKNSYYNGGSIRVEKTGTDLLAGLGGLIGKASNTATTAFVSIESCSVSGTLIAVKGEGDEIQYGDYVGGLIGWMEGRGESSITDCHLDGITLLGKAEIGGLAGRVGVDNKSYLTIDNSSLINSSITGTGSNAGGLIGRHQKGSLSLTGSFAEAPVTGIGNIGGLIGNFGGSADTETISVSESRFTGAVTSTGGAAVNAQSGGLIGVIDTNTGVSITDSYAGGTVEATGYRVGGLVGYLNLKSAGTIQRCYTTNTVTGNSGVGGIGGTVDNATTSLLLKQSYATGKVTAASTAGGLIGNYNAGSDFVIEESYAINEVVSTAASALVGGLVGATSGNVSNITIKNSVAANSALSSSNSTGFGNIIGSSKDNAVILENTIAFAGTVHNKDYTVNTAAKIFNAPEETKAVIVSKSTYEDAPKSWDFTDTWVFGNEYYRLPVLKGLLGQATVQPAHLALSSDVSLSQLAVNHGTLSPAFSAEETDYTVDVIHIVDNIDLTVVANDESAILTGDSGSKPLSVGSNVFSIHVAAEDQVNSADYSLTVTRADATADATLSALSVNKGTLTPAFDPLVSEYSVTLPYVDADIEITATTNGENASLSGNGVQNLTVGDNELIVLVTAENGTTTGSYKITVTRTAAATDATLKTLTINNGTLSPAFSPAITDYTVNVAYVIESITIAAEANDSKAISVTGTGEQNLNIGENTFNIVVTAEDSEVTNTYTIKVTRTAASTDATLKTLTVSNGTLTPAFSPAITDYTVNVTRSIDKITIVAEANDSKAISVTGTGEQNLIIGENTFNIVITAEDSGVTNTYTIVVTRSDGSAINDLQANKVIVSVKDRTILVTGAKDTITVTSISGINRKYQSLGTDTYIPVNTTGVYVLTVNGSTYKILVK